MLDHSAAKIAQLTRSSSTMPMTLVGMTLLETASHVSRGNLAAQVVASAHDAHLEHFQVLTQPRTQLPASPAWSADSRSTKTTPGAPRARLASFKTKRDKPTACHACRVPLEMDQAQQDAQTAQQASFPNSAATIPAQCARLASTRIRKAKPSVYRACQASMGIQRV